MSYIYDDLRDQYRLYNEAMGMAKALGLTKEEQEFLKMEAKNSM